MPEINTPQPGTFCWIELATTDPRAALTFYSNVFGWSVRESSMGENGSYWIFQKNERDCASMYEQMADERAKGYPPHWTSYIGVERIEASLDHLRELGGSVLHGPFDVRELGRMAIVLDAQGAMFCLWEAKQSVGVRIRDEVNTLCWNELATRDPEAALLFYRSFAGWEMQGSPDYVEIHHQGHGIGGIRKMRDEETAPPNWSPYFMVEDCDAATAAIEKHGGRTCMPPTTLHGGRFAVFTDPQGALFSIYQVLNGGE